MPKLPLSHRTLSGNIVLRISLALHIEIYSTYTSSLDNSIILKTITLVHSGHSSSPNTADVPHVTISVTMFPMSSLLLVGTVLYLVMFSVTAFSGRGWLRDRDRVTEPLVWLMARDWTASAVKSATCTPSTTTVYHSVG